MLAAGDTAPDFTLPAHTGETIDSRGLRDDGRWLVMWWYPKAATPG